ncbi:MAG: SHOCT domain-containing protein, partial [Burkholderiaceae bacterium]|nr:SHOCT domain-containing protein [Burkholderiaceae bacterium]
LSQRLTQILAEKLEQLDELLKKGLITKKDYDIKKAEILKAL